MPDALFTLALLACPVGMGLMMWFMMRGGQHGDRGQGAGMPDAEVVRLRAEVDQLRAERRDQSSGEALPRT